MFSILRPYIFSLDPETAHDLAIKSLKFNFIPSSFFKVEHEELLATQLFNKEIKNPIGLAAGFDKSAEVYNPLFNLGYGFVEVGYLLQPHSLSACAALTPSEPAILARLHRAHFYRFRRAPR